MKIYLAHNGFLVIDTGASKKDFNHSLSTPITIEKVGSQIYILYNGDRVAKSDYSQIFQSDGVTPAGATVDLAATYIENLITVAES